MEVVHGPPPLLVSIRRDDDHQVSFSRRASPDAGLAEASRNPSPLPETGSGGGPGSDRRSLSSERRLGSHRGHHHSSAETAHVPQQTSSVNRQPSAGGGSAGGVPEAEHAASAGGSGEGPEAHPAPQQHEVAEDQDAGEEAGPPAVACQLPPVGPPQDAAPAAGEARQSERPRRSRSQERLRANSGTRASTAPEKESAPAAGGSSGSRATGTSAKVGPSSGTAGPKERRRTSNRGAAAGDEDVGGEAGPGVDGDPEGILVGIESLPMVGAAGVLVLPKRPRTELQEALDPNDISFSLLGGPVAGWGPACDREDNVPHRLFEMSRAERVFSQYATVETGIAAKEMARKLEQPDLEQLKHLAMEQYPVRPSQGPGLLQLALDPQRRDECPVCAAEWGQAVRYLQAASLGEAGQTAAVVAAMGPGGSGMAGFSGLGGGNFRRGAVNAKSKKMHSLRCTWAWFQQNLSSNLRLLRFDENGAPRASPPSPSTVLPPPIADVWQYWGKKGTKLERERTAAVDRLARADGGP